MNLDNYKISCELAGHTLDVRSVSGASDGTIVSGSRDKTAKIWKPLGDGYTEALTLVNHKNYISCVYYMEAENWLCTGSNDSTVCIYTFGSSTPFATLTGHSSTVCCLHKGLTPHSLITGSWDKTAKIWELSEVSCTEKVTLTGHEAAVWAVGILPRGRYVTGSADKNIFIWNDKGVKVQVLKGHTDCVRGLVGLNNNFLLSCGNDAVIKLWNDSGEHVRDFNGHGNYIYCIALHQDNDTFITGSEDNSIRLWSISRGGALGHGLALPAQSVWSVAFLKNGDIITGSSDAIVRLFTSDAHRMASPELQETFKNSVEQRILEQAKELGGVKVTELPGPESLLQDGVEGQTRIVRQPNGKIFCYQWTKDQWNCLGDVVGASGGTQANSGKKLFEGKEYDYVFDVDISDTDPPIKLPYNRGEDPWMEAQKFIHKNNLPQAYLEQVANFIIKNADAVAMAPPTVGYEDPFTGDSRYIPNLMATTTSESGVNLDPFTGGNSYSTAISNPKMYNTHFPINKYISLDVCDPAKVLLKLKEFNEKTEDVSIRVTNDHLDSVIKLAQQEPLIENDSINVLKTLYKWPKDILFPVLDITRLAIRHNQICAQIGNVEFVQMLVENLGCPPANQLMAIRCLNNMLQHSSGRKLIEIEFEKVVYAVSQINQGSANLQLAMSAFFLNLTIPQLSATETVMCTIITESIIGFLKWARDNESTYRICQAIGNLSLTSSKPIIVQQLRSADDIAKKIKDLIFGAESPKLQECARFINELISN